MSDLGNSRGSRTLESPYLTVDAGKSTELGPPSNPDPESTDPYLRQRDLSAEAAAALRYVPLDPPGRPDSIGRLAHYEVLSVVGRGAMGLVVRAFDTQLARTVAIKLMSPHLTSSVHAVSRFNREARAAAGINHPNVVTIHAVSEHEGIPFLVMEYVDGISLMDRIRSDLPLNLMDVIRIGVQIASGLAAAHRHGVIHRDIKPANIMLENSIDRVKITDFGLARVLLDQSELTSQGVVVGTPAYMSPEQVNGIPLDPRSDLFSLGCVLYAMIAGHSPFRAENALGTARRVAALEHVPLGDINKSVPGSFVKVVDRLLEKEPGERYQSADEVVEELTFHLARLNQGLDLSDDRSPGPIVADHWPGILWLGVALILAVVAVLVAYRAKDPPAIVGRTPIPVSPSPGAILTVAKHKAADCTSIAEAIRRARPGQRILVTDTATYDEPILMLDPGRLAGVRLETNSSAVIKASGNRQVILIQSIPRMAISGFLIEAESGQHAIDIRGECPGVVIEDCEIVCPSDSDRGVVYLHAGAAGTADEPIRLSDLRIRCGGVGVVVGEFIESMPVGFIEVSDNRIRARSRDHGIPVVVQGHVRHVSITHNLLATAYAGVSFRFPAPDCAADVVVAENSFGDLQHSFAIIEPSPANQGIQILDNLIVDAARIHLDGGIIEPYSGWLGRNWWERGPDFDERLDGLFPRLTEPLALKSRDPSSDDFLEPVGARTVPWAGRYRIVKPPGGSDSPSPGEQPSTR